MITFNLKLTVFEVRHCISILEVHTLFGKNCMHEICRKTILCALQSLDYNDESGSQNDLLLRPL